jgi:hypothetical protein
VREAQDVTVFVGEQQRLRVRPGLNTSMKR